MWDESDDSEEDSSTEYSDSSDDEAEVSSSNADIENHSAANCTDQQDTKASKEEGEKHARLQPKQLNVRGGQDGRGAGEKRQNAEEGCEAVVTAAAAKQVDVPVIIEMTGSEKKP